MDTLAQIAVREPLQLRGLEFGALFTWLSNSMAAVSRSQVGDEIPLVKPGHPVRLGQGVSDQRLPALPAEPR